MQYYTSNTLGLFFCVCAQSVTTTQQKALLYIDCLCTISHCPDFLSDYISFRQQANKKMKHLFFWRASADLLAENTEWCCRKHCVLVSRSICILERFKKGLRIINGLVYQ